MRERERGAQKKENLITSVNTTWSTLGGASLGRGAKINGGHTRSWDIISKPVQTGRNVVFCDRIQVSKDWYLPCFIIDRQKRQEKSKTGFLYFLV